MPQGAIDKKSGLVSVHRRPEARMKLKLAIDPDIVTLRRLVTERDADLHFPVQFLRKRRE